MINQIQLRGISRTPSDRMTPDGGCAESLNIHIDNQELAPTLAPVDVTTREGISGGLLDDIVYIHKTSSYEHYICYDADCLYWSEDPENLFVDLSGLGGELVDITSIGNTIIVQTNLKKVYSSFIDGEYKDLGAMVPMPDVSVVETDGGPSMETLEWDVFDTTVSGIKDGVTENLMKAYLGMMTPEKLEQFRAAYEGEYLIDAKDVDGNNSGVDAKTTIGGASSYIWSLLEKMRGIKRGQDMFCMPVFLRYAVRLYDNSYIYQSIPIFLGGGHNEGVSVHVHPVSSVAPGARASMKYGFTHCHKNEVEITWEIGRWKDIVKSIDLFLSTDVCNPQWRDLVWDMDAEDKLIFKSQYKKNVLKLTEDEILSKVNFYKVESISSDELDNGHTKTIQLKPVSQDSLAVKETLPDGYLTFHETSAISGLSTYNERLILKGLRSYFYDGYQYLQGLVKDYDGTVTETDNWSIRYFIRLNGGVVRTASGDAYSYDDAYPRGILFYPDPRCFKAEVSIGDGRIYTIPMKEHPGLNMSYAFCDLGTSLLTGTESRVEEWKWDDDNTFEENDVVVQSESSNPFLFTAANRLRFTARVTGVATTTKALSTGQFGAFPIYIFTDDGIYATSINDEGSIVACHPVSRDVAIDGSVTPVDQAIIFVSDKGVMMLTGSEVKCISPNMNGRHYTIEGDVMNLLSKDKVWVRYIPTLVDSTPFMDFMKKAKAVVDYAGSRVIFFHSEEPAQYVYQMDSDTWHKTAVPGCYPLHAVNSYPEAFVVCRDKEYITHLMDFTTTHEVDRENTRCIIVTRAIDLDKPDMRKVIKEVRVRGDHKAKAVRYILLGSMDGRSYGILPSLRGGSYKYFRIVILADLSPTERISYAEVDYETRFTNRLR